MPRFNVIVLDQTPDDPNTYRFAMWADVPAARQSRYASTSTSTTFSAWTSASTADTDALKSGAVVEKVASQRVPAGSSLAQVEAFLQTQWAAYQATVTSYNPWQRYGSTWDGTTWVVTNNG